MDMDIMPGELPVPNWPAGIASEQYVDEMQEMPDPLPAPLNEEEDEDEPRKQGRKRLPKLLSVVGSEVEVKPKLAEDEFVVERILGYKQINRVLYARVKWRGFRHSTWEPKDSIFFVSAAELKRKRAREKVEKEEKRINMEKQKRLQERSKKAEKVLLKRSHVGRVVYKVRWIGHPKVVDTWITEAKLNRPDLVAQMPIEAAAENPDGFSCVAASHEEPGTSANSAPQKSKLLNMLAQRKPVNSETDNSEDSESKPGTAPEKKRSTTPTLALKREMKPVARKRLPDVKKTPVYTKYQQETAKLQVSGFDIRVQRTTTKDSKRSRIDLPRETSSMEIPDSVQSWSADQVFAYLSQQGFADAAGKVRAGGVNGEIFLGLTDPLSFKGFDIPLGPGLKISRLIREMKETSGVH